MNGWINGLTVYNVHVMFEISAKTIYMTTVKIERAFIHLRSHIHLYIIHMK